MPSKKKSSRKSSSKSNVNDDYSSSPSIPSTPSSKKASPEDEQAAISSAIDEASTKFPCLISRNAIVARVSDNALVDTPHCNIWLSLDAMHSASIMPRSLVSVSLFDLDGRFPLTDLSHECSSRFGFQLPKNQSTKPGNFFALATVLPSSKEENNGVHFSTSLSYTLGCPASGRIVFLCPVKAVSSIEDANAKPLGFDTNYLLSDCCKELYLSPVSLKETSISSRLDLSNEVINDQVRNVKSLSPKTPSISESRGRSPSPMQFCTLRNKNSASRTATLLQQSFDIHDLKHGFANEPWRRLLNTCTSKWLCSRTLVSGNFVTVPVASRLCIFQVAGSKRMLLDSESQGNDKKIDVPAQDSHLREETICSLSVDIGTKIHILLPGDNTFETSVTESTAISKPGFEHNLPKLGGLSKEFAIVKDIIVSSAIEGTLASMGLRPTKGVLLHGPSGTGKTTFARISVHNAGVNMFSVNGPEIISQNHGESEQALHEVFAKANQATPAVIFIDELDAIAPARKDGGDELSQRMVATLLNLMDGICKTDGIVIIAATNRPDSIEPALRRPGRLDREIEIGVPSPVQRHDVLSTLLSEMQHSLSEKDIQQLAMVTHGFVGADLAALCREAALVRLRQYVSAASCDDLDYKISTVAFDSVCHTSKQTHDVCLRSDTDAPNVTVDSISHFEDALPSTSESRGTSECTNVGGVQLRVTCEDFEKARVRVRPSAMREINLEVPKVSWEDVGGQREVKLQLMEAVEWPQKHKDAFERIGTRPPTGILLFGPPGCSKTLLARAVASEAGLNFLAVKGPELFSKWVGESEKAVRSLFVKARSNAPSIVFFDEIDGLAAIRGHESDGVSVGDRVMSQLLVELDGLQERGSVTVIAATNRPDKIDPALLRPGRFDRLLYVGPPNAKDREDIFRVHLQRVPCSSNVSVSEISLLTEGCTGADISLICREAGLAAIEENLSASEITMEHLKCGIQQVHPSDVRIYEKLSIKFQRLVHSNSEGGEL